VVLATGGLPIGHRVNVPSPRAGFTTSTTHAEQP
jgi:hypothetical protein